jgi:tRNA nucleotidyltransferase (CCA-adding enzyme)
MGRHIDSSRNLRALMRDHLPPKIFNRLEEAGRLAERSGVSAFAVGGLVRDLLLRHKNLDVDIAVEGDGMAFAHLLADHYKGGLKIFERFATAFVVYPDGFKLDVASARRENYAHPTALPVVAPASIKEDLYRRDFTINALALHLNRNDFGELIDFYGGWRDVKNKTIRVLHDRSFVDDPTRVFRAIRFTQRFGFRIENNTLRLLKETAADELIHRLSGPRLRNEVMLLLSEKNPLRAVRQMARLDLLRFLHSRLKLTPYIAALFAKIPPAIAWWNKRFPDRPLDHSLVYFMALVDGLSDAAMDAMLRRLTMPNRQASKVRMVNSGLRSALRGLSQGRLPKPSEAYRLLAALPDEGLILLAAKARSPKVKRVLTAHLTTYQHVNASLTGRDLNAMGLKPGPLYKKVLDRLLAARLNGEVKTDAEERALAKRLARL